MNQRSPRHHWLALAACGLSLTACASDVTLRNPQTGELATCRESLDGFNPWSQKDACVVGYITQGWTTTERDPGITLDGNPPPGKPSQ
jgi:hypothetical protein